MSIDLPLLARLATVVIAAVMLLLLWDALQVVRLRRATLQRRRGGGLAPGPGQAAAKGASGDDPEEPADPMPLAPPGLRTLHRESGLSMRLPMLVGLSALAGLFLALVIGRLGFPLPVQVAAAPLATIALVFGLLRRARERRLARFVEQLPEALGVVVRALRAGHPPSSGLEMAAAELADPAAGEFRELSRQVKLGLPLADAIERLYKRMPCAEVRYLAVAVSVQAEAGGNIVETLRTLAQSIRESIWFRKRVRALTAEGKLTARALLLLPVIVAVLMQILSPDFFTPLVESRLFWGLLVFCVLMMTGGYLAVRRLVDLEA